MTDPIDKLIDEFLQRSRLRPELAAVTRRESVALPGGDPTVDSTATGGLGNYNVNPNPVVALLDAASPELRDINTPEGKMDLAGAMIGGGGGGGMAAGAAGGLKVFGGRSLARKTSLRGKAFRQLKGVGTGARNTLSTRRAERNLMGAKPSLWQRLTGQKQQKALPASDASKELAELRKQVADLAAGRLPLPLQQPSGLTAMMKGQKVPLETLPYRTAPAQGGGAFVDSIPDNVAMAAEKVLEGGGPAIRKLEEALIRDGVPHELIKSKIQDALRTYQSGMDAATAGYLEDVVRIAKRSRKGLLGAAGPAALQDEK